MGELFNLSVSSSVKSEQGGGRSNPNPHAHPTPGSLRESPKVQWLGLLRGGLGNTGFLLVHWFCDVLLECFPPDSGSEEPSLSIASAWQGF